MLKQKLFVALVSTAFAASAFALVTPAKPAAAAAAKPAAAAVAKPVAAAAVKPAAAAPAAPATAAFAPRKRGTRGGKHF